MNIVASVVSGVLIGISCMASNRIRCDLKKYGVDVE